MITKSFEGKSFEECSKQYFEFASEHPDKKFETMGCGFTRSNKGEAVYFLDVEEVSLDKQDS